MNSSASNFTTTTSSKVPEEFAQPIAMKSPMFLQGSMKSMSDLNRSCATASSTISSLETEVIPAKAPTVKDNKITSILLLPEDKDTFMNEDSFEEDDDDLVSVPYSDETQNKADLLDKFINKEMSQESHEKFRTNMLSQLRPKRNQQASLVEMTPELAEKILQQFKANKF